jgi:hypothetical protein
MNKKVKAIESSNTLIWESLCETDPSRTKAFNKGYRGTSINPNYIYEKLTQVFGPCGSGWGFKVEDQGFQGESSNSTHWVQISFWHSENDSISIPAFGCTTFTGKNKNGFFMDEDAPKKSLTDALTKATQLIGMSADIFGGQWDDCKYVAELKQKYSAEEEPDTPPQKMGYETPQGNPPASFSKPNYPKIAKEAEANPGAVDYPVVSEAQRKLLYAKFKAAKFTDGQMKEFLQATYGIDSSKKFPRSEVNTFIEMSDAGKLVPVSVEGDDDLPF